MDDVTYISALFFLAIILFYWFFLRRSKPTSGKFIICEKNKYNFQYVSKPVKIPPIRGSILSHMAVEGGFHKFRNVKFNESPTYLPFMEFDEVCAKSDEHDESVSDEAIEKFLVEGDKLNSTDFSFYSVSDYISQYRSGKLTPSQVAERLLIGIQSTSELRCVVKYNEKSLREMAEASTERYKSNSTLSPIDGIFVVVKDEYAVKGHCHSNGTSFLGRGSVSTFNSALVEKVEKLGGIIFAVANMHELGLGTTGNNSNKGFGTCRNPYNVNHYPGGSSSGSAAAVGSGLCVMGLGTDGGGSIRVPSCYCGVVGLKATFARFNLARMRELSYTVGHGGPICANVKDAALFYALLAGPDPGYKPGLRQPKVKLPSFVDNLNGIKLAIDRRFFNDCDEDVLGICNKSLDILTNCGAQLDDIEVPELNENLLAHRIIIICEMSSGINYDFDVNYEEISHPSRIFFRVGSSLTAVDYLQALKQRTRAMQYFKQLFKNVDAFVTPTTAHSAPKIVASELASGMLNGQQDTKNMRFVSLGNLIGCPAITIPVGYNQAGLPIGLQVMSAWWREDMIFKIAELVERHIGKKKPKVFADILEV